MKRAVFRDYDQAELDRQYDQRAWAANAIELINRYAADSAAVRKQLGEPDTYDYGDTRAESLDLFRTHRGPAPVHVFIHGGAWRLLSARDSAFPAECFVRAGAHYVALDFALLPLVPLDVMVDQVRSAIAWLHRYANQFGGDPDRIFVSGHSSGAHLAAAVATTDWKARYRLPQDVVKGVLCCSGIYDLEPVRLSARNDFVQLDDALVEALSPIRHLANLRCPVTLAFGERESDEFKRQARDFAVAAERHGVPVGMIEGAGLNHFEIITTLASPTGLLGRVALHQMGLGFG
jgi:arylformamidase